MSHDGVPGNPGLELLPVPLGQSQPPVPIQPSGYFPVVVAAPRPVPWYLDLGGVWRRHRSLTVIVVVVCALFGLLVGTVFRTNLWTVEGRLRFTMQKPDPGRVAYESMSLYSNADLFANEALLKTVAVKFADRLPQDNPVRFLQKEIKVDTPRMSDQVEVKFDAADPAFGVLLVDSLMERHVEFTNQLRRNAVLQSAGRALEHKIVDAGATIKRLQNACEEYRSRLRANLPSEKLETAELDSYHSQRRKALVEDMEKQKSEIKKHTIGLDAKRTKLEQQRILLKQGAIAPADLEALEQEVSVAEKQLKLEQDQLRRIEERYRMVPIEYAESEILRLETLKTVAQQDLKLLDAKRAVAAAKRIDLDQIDPNDEDWQRLRLQLLGPDNPEFSILKPATAPPYPTVSNRKLLSLLAFALPLGLAYLFVAGMDHFRLMKSRIESPAAPRPEWIETETPLPTDESPLMKARMHQWLNGAMGKGRPAKRAKQGPDSPESTPTT